MFCSSFLGKAIKGNGLSFDKFGGKKVVEG
jgi:hypothetical protein